MYSRDLSILGLPPAGPLPESSSDLRKHYDATLLNLKRTYGGEEVS